MDYNGFVLAQWEDDFKNYGTPRSEHYPLLNVERFITTEGFVISWWFDQRFNTVERMVYGAAGLVFHTLWREYYV